MHGSRWVWGGLLMCLSACRLAAQFCMIIFFRLLFKNTQELSNFLYAVPQPKPAEVFGKPLVFSKHSGLSHVPYGLLYLLGTVVVGCLTVLVVLYRLSCCDLGTVE